MQAQQLSIYLSLWRLLKYFIQFTAAAQMHECISVVHECARFDGGVGIVKHILGYCFTFFFPV